MLVPSVSATFHSPRSPFEWLVMQSTYARVPKPGSAQPALDCVSLVKRVRDKGVQSSHVCTKYVWQRDERFIQGGNRENENHHLFTWLINLFIRANLKAQAAPAAGIRTSRLHKFQQPITSMLRNICQHVLHKNQWLINQVSALLWRPLSISQLIVN